MLPHGGAQHSRGGITAENFAVSRTTAVCRRKRDELEIAMDGGGVGGLKFLENKGLGGGVGRDRKERIEGEAKGGLSPFD